MLCTCAVVVAAFGCRFLRLALSVDGPWSPCWSVGLPRMIRHLRGVPRRRAARRRREVVRCVSDERCASDEGCVVDEGSSPAMCFAN